MAQTRLFFTLAQLNVLVSRSTICLKRRLRLVEISEEVVNRIEFISERVFNASNGKEMLEGHVGESGTKQPAQTPSATFHGGRSNWFSNHKQTQVEFVFINTDLFAPR